MGGYFPDVSFGHHRARLEQSGCGWPTALRFAGPAVGVMQGAADVIDDVLVSDPVCGQVNTE
jgi:hypothetical protein